MVLHLYFMTSAFRTFDQENRNETCS